MEVLEPLHILKDVTLVRFVEKDAVKSAGLLEVVDALSAIVPLKALSAPLLELNTAGENVTPELQAVPSLLKVAGDTVAKLPEVGD